MLLVLTSIGRFFSLEALDTRITPPKDLKKIESIKRRASPDSKWSTVEYKVYLVVFAMVVPYMLKTAMDASNETNPNFPKFQHLLSPGWMFGRYVDNSDVQYRFFRDNFFLLLGLIVSHVSLRKGLELSFNWHSRNTFDFVFGVVFLLGAHGVNSIKVAVHVFISYFIAKYVSNRKLALALTWIYGLSTLFINDRFHNSKVGLSFIDQGFTGIVDRWDVFFNFTVLRMISFNYDYIENLSQQHESTTSLDSSANEKLADLDDRQRLVAPIPISDYSVFNYIAYLTYTPLFIAGPVITFNDYMYQSKYQQLPSVKDYKRTFRYFLRLMFCVLVMEFLLHFMYVVAVSKRKAWEGDTPFQMSMIGFINLNIIWLKLLIPWRLFRFWSLLDGIDPPENMIRCMNNNYSALAFWRAWHRSYNRWVIRYIYVPLGGGGNNRVVNSLLVFSFVAIWHDIELKLLMWGWLVVFFLLPEIGATIYFAKYQNEPWFRHLCGVGAVINIWMMILANLFGFCLGKDGTVSLLHEMFGTIDGFRFFVVSSFCLFVGAQIMFELRQTELRRGIYMRC